MIEGVPMGTRSTHPDRARGSLSPMAELVRDVILVAVAYLVAGRLGLMVASIGENITLVWLPTGIAVAALYRLGLRRWPGVAFGALAVNVVVGTPLWVSLAMAAGNTVSPLVTVVLLRRLGFHEALDRSRDILLLCIAAVVGMVISASSGVSALSLADRLPNGIGAAWLLWWAGDVMGAVSVGPLLLSFNKRELRAILDRRVEFLALSALTGLAAWWVFVLNRGQNGQALSLAFVPLPFVAWGALRFGAVGASLTIIGVCIGAAYGTASGAGPFYRSAPIVGPMALALFMATSAVLGWMITAVNLARLVATDRQRLLERALSDVSLGVLISDTNRLVTYANLGFTRLTGYGESELLGKTCGLLLGPLSDPHAARELQTSLNELSRFDGDILNYRKDGSSFWNGLLVSPVLDEYGTAVGFMGVHRDVTRQRDAEAALLESGRRLDDVLSAIDNVVYSSTPDGGALLFISRAAETLYGRGVADFLTDPLARSRSVHPDDRERAEAAVRQARETGQFDVDYRLLRVDGSQRWVRDHGRVALDENGQPCRIDGVVTDITERKTAEEAVLQNAERLRLALAASNQGLFDLDVSTGVTVVNEEYARLLGYDPSDFVETNTAWEERLHPSERAQAVAAFNDFLSGGVPEYRVEFRQRTRSGEWKWILSLGDVVTRGADGQPLRMLGTFTDITERKRAEVVSAAERDVLDLLSIGEPLTVVLTRLASCYEEIFPGTMVSILRLDEAGRRLSQLAAPHLPPAFSLAADGVEIGPDSCTWGVAAFEGKIVQAADIQTDPLPAACQEIALAHGLRSCCAAPVVSSRGRVLGTFATFRREPHRADAAEIAMLERCARFAAMAIERHQLAQSLLESQVRLKTLVGHLPGMAYRCLNDVDWTMTYCSDGCEALTGYVRDELESNGAISYADLIHPDDRSALWAKCQASLDARIPCQNEYRIIDRQGRERWVSERASGHYAETGELLSIDGFIQDITESRRVALERGLLERKMLETQKLESLGVLAGGIAHDFNNILSGILGNASLGVAHVEAGAPEEEYFLDIAESARRAADLCRQMLAYAGKGRFIVRALDLSHLVESTTPMLRPSVSKSAQLRFQLATELPAVEGDATQIRQVLMNLVINASEAIGERSGVICISTGLAHADRVSLEESHVAGDVAEGNYVYLEVSDSGAGMPPDTRARIFDPFFTTKFTGRGLGLAAVLGIVRGHRGALTLHSEVGQGTTFRILFPVAAGPADPVASSKHVDAAWRGEGTVLVVDDEESVRGIIGRMLRAAGFDVVLTGDGEAAVELMQADPSRFALVLLDLTMPGRNGEEILADLLALHPNARVILMSGYSEQEALTRFPSTGLTSFLQKPFSYESLREVVKSVLPSHV